MGCLIPTDQCSTHIHMGSVNWTWQYDLECWCAEVCCSHTGALAPASWMHPLLNSVVISQRWRESYSLLLELSSPPRSLCLQILVLPSTCYVVWHTLPTLDRFILSFCTGGTDICLRVEEGTRLYFFKDGNTGQYAENNQWVCAPSHVGLPCCGLDPSVMGSGDLSFPLLNFVEPRRLPWATDYSTGDPVGQVRRGKTV